MKRILLCSLAAATLSSCTYVQVTDPSLPAGTISSAIAKGGSLAPLTGPAEADADLCAGKGMNYFALRVTTGQYFWNMFLGLFSSEFTVDYSCAEGKGK